MANYTGIVKWFDNSKGYGFVSSCDGNDVFLHHSQMKRSGGGSGIHQGQELSFDVVRNKRGPAAVNVQVIR